MVTIIRPAKGVKQVRETAEFGKIIVILIFFFLFGKLLKEKSRNASELLTVVGGNYWSVWQQPKKIRGKSLEIGEIHGFVSV